VTIVPKACGSFASGRPGAKGSLSRHAKLLEFIGRNYAATPEGCWYFQNGPATVLPVDGEAAPWIWRISPDGRIRSQTGRAAHIEVADMDERGHAYLQTHPGSGLIHTRKRRPWRQSPLTPGSGYWNIACTQSCQTASTTFPIRRH
jgi:hypothetical protein